MSKAVVKQFILWIILLLLFIPLIQTTYPFAKLQPLKGSFTLAEKPDSILENWFSGEYQVQYEKYFNDSIGFRPLFVRIKNQIDFWCFNKSNANNGLVGKDEYLFDSRYIDAYLGVDFVGYNTIQEKVKKLSQIQKSLKLKNKDLIVVFAPGKASFYSDKFPKKIDEQATKTSNYDTYCELLVKEKINFIDFNSVFLKMKETSSYNLYPKAAYHWSVYGMTLAFDSLIRYIEDIRKINLPHLRFDNIELSDTARDPDYDLGSAMNLLFEVQQGQLAYPKVIFETDSTTTKPNAIVIGDSFYTYCFRLFDQSVFNESQFWYYMKQVEYHNNPPKKIEDIDAMAEINKTDIVILIATELNLNIFPFEFIELFDSKENYEITRVENNIRGNKEWFDAVKKQAIERNIPLNEMIHQNAIFTIKNRKN